MAPTIAALCTLVLAMDAFNLCVQASFNVNLTARYDGGQNPIYELQVAPGLDLDGVKDWRRSLKLRN